MDPGVTVSQLLDGGPVVPSKWNASRADENLVRLGLIWKCYRIVQKLGLGYCPGLLPPYPLWEYEWRQYTLSLDQGQGLETSDLDDCSFGGYRQNFILIDDSSI